MMDLPYTPTREGGSGTPPGGLGFRRGTRTARLRSLLMVTVCWVVTGDISWERR